MSYTISSVNAYTATLQQWYVNDCLWVSSPHNS